MYNCDYIGYRKSIGDLLSSGATAASSGARVFATGGADISADIALIASGVNASYGYLPTVSLYLFICQLNLGTTRFEISAKIPFIWSGEDAVGMLLSQDSSSC